MIVVRFRKFDEVATVRSDQDSILANSTRENHRIRRTSTDKIDASSYIIGARF